MAKLCRLPLVERLNQIFISFLILHSQLKVRQRLQRRYWVISRIWTRLSCSDCKRSRPRNDKSFHETPLADWSLLLSQNQDFLKAHLTRVPTTLNRPKTMEIWDEVFSSVGAQHLDTGGYHLSDLEDFEYHWEDPDSDMDAVSQPGINAPLYTSISKDFEIGSMAENPILTDEVQDNEIFSAHPPTTPVCVRPTKPPVLIRSCTLGSRIENRRNYF